MLLPPVQNSLSRSVQKSLDSTLAGNVTIGSIHVNLFTSATARNVVIYNPSRPADSIIIQKITIKYWLPGLINKSIVITSAVAEEVSVTISALPSKENPLPITPVGKKSNWKFVIGSVHIINMKLNYTDTVSNVNIVVENSDASVQFVKQDSISALIAVPRGNAVSPLWSGTIDTLKTALSLYSQKILVDTLIFRGSGTLQMPKELLLYQTPETGV